MKKLFGLFVFCFLLIPSVAFGSPLEDKAALKSLPTQSQTIAGTEEQIMPVIVDENSIAGMKDMDIIPQQRGCCSHHGGVCGCEGGRAVCCDGRYSPTCGC
ncbi:hypothetical protein [Azotosporobacter soli]|uniref:hypothetical protein n=1 Tax=Azotosporobacter soli TaxID=3055040 RepID=UPI0031FE6E09